MCSANYIEHYDPLLVKLRPLPIYSYLYHLSLFITDNFNKFTRISDRNRGMHTINSEILNMPTNGTNFIKKLKNLK